MVNSFKDVLKAVVGKVFGVVDKAFDLVDYGYEFVGRVFEEAKAASKKLHEIVNGLIDDLL